MTGLLLVVIFFTIRGSTNSFGRYRISQASVRDIEQLKINIIDYTADLKSIINELKRIAAAHCGEYSAAAPKGLIAKTVNSTQVQLSWTASTAVVEVEGYRIYRDGIQVGSSASASYLDAGLAPAKSYAYSVAAVYRGGAISTQTIPISVTTKPLAVKVFPGLSESFKKNSLDPKRWCAYTRPNSAYPNPNTAVGAKNQRLEIMTTQGITEGGFAGICTVLPYDASHSDSALANQAAHGRPVHNRSKASRGHCTHAACAAAFTT
jgi:Fibronectin type III domain